MGIFGVEIQEDGSLYFAVDEPPGHPRPESPDGSHGRFFECVVEYEEEKGEYVLSANDHEVARF